MDARESGPDKLRDGGSGAARNYSWPPFEVGNTASLAHGAYSRRVVAR
jgi:hypothetical protein